MLESNAQSAAAQSYESYGHQQQQHHIHQNNDTPTGNSGSGIGYNEIKIEEHVGAQRPTTNHHHSSNVVINNVYGGSLDDDIINTVDIQNNDNYLNSVSEEPELFFVDHDSVSVSSPSPEYGSTPSTSSYFPSSTFSNRPVSDAEMYLPPSPTGLVAQPHQELPTRIPTGPYDPSSVGASGSEDGFTPEHHFGVVSDAILNSQSSDFTHSGITHPGVDAVIIGEDNTAYGGSSISIPSSTERLSTSTSTQQDMLPSSTEQVHKVTYPKPAFRPKPTKKPSNGDKYVLVQTINHDSPIKTETPAKPQGTMSDNDIESIESIILMLNDTKTGPQYNTGSSTEAPYDHSSSGSTYTGSAQSSFSIYGAQGTAQTSTSNINYEKYGPSSYYITTKLPATNPAELPSTSYVFSPQPTRRPISVQSTIASSYGAVSPEINSDHLHIPSSTLSPPVNDHVVITKRPVILTAASFATTTSKPSSNYVYISTPTRQPISADEIIVSSTTKDPTTTNKQTKRPSTKIPTTRQPSTSFVTGPTTPRSKKTSTKSPSTSFDYTSTATRQPATRPTNKINNRKNATTDSPTMMFRPAYGDQPSSTPQENIVYEHVIQSKPLGQHPYVQISTENPSPTVHITPKPTVNLVTSSTWTQQPSLINRYTTPIIKSPSTSYIFSPVSTMRPGGGASATPIFSSGYGSSITYSSSPANKNPDTSDFDDPGYYGISSTHRPNTAPQSATASSVYTVYDPTAPAFPGFYGSTPSFGPEVIEYSTLKDEFYTSPNDYNNFPPVRNPNLNISSGAAAGAMDEYDISTPAFIEDDALNDKMGLLVSKIVESLSGNFEQLADVVYDDTVVQADPIATSARPATTVKRPTTGTGTTKKPAQRVTTKKPSTNAAKPATTNAKPTSRPGTVTTKRPAGTKVSTTKPASSSQNPKRTTKKPPTTLNTTKKPSVTKVSINRKFVMTDLLSTKHITVTNNSPTDREAHKKGHADNNCSTGRNCRRR